MLIYNCIYSNILPINSFVFISYGYWRCLEWDRLNIAPRLNRNCDYKYLNYRVYNLTYHINDTKIFPLKTYAYYNFIHCKQFGIPLYFK